MQTNNLPTEDLKRYGIVEADNSFSKKLSAEDIKKFLQGYSIVADNKYNRATFQLVENNSRLNVIFLERDKNISNILAESRSGVAYSEIRDLSKQNNQFNIDKKAFVYDRESNTVVEFDVLKDARELTAVIAKKNNVSEISRYETELLKLKGFLQDKIEHFPDIAKEITDDLNIVSQEINSIKSLSGHDTGSSKEKQSEVQLNVNDPDLYQDANRAKEQEHGKEENPERSRAFRR